MHDPRTLGNSPPKRRFTSWKNSPVKHLQSSPPPSQNRSNTDHIEQAIIWKTSCSSSEPTVRHLPHPLILKIQHACLKENATTTRIQEERAGQSPRSYWIVGIPLIWFLIHNNNNNNLDKCLYRLGRKLRLMPEVSPRRLKNLRPNVRSAG
ncbi:hypothetical protein PGT21_034095 [Puccinia graminis f. sp. tritici]|uniref:Uncharacterized protein n=1 Tax=Puccinia graminis f. sp. tritici TaxID=56615 RepID=A0A5B0QD19_PUCGR|nr:hypothetical protein PGT21_034095 [Puccinia graminis f. sp. tritici]